MSLNIIKGLPSKDLVDENLHFGEEFCQIITESNAKLVLSIGIGVDDLHVKICVHPEIAKDGIIKALETAINKIKDS